MNYFDQSKWIWTKDFKEGEITWRALTIKLLKVKLLKRVELFSTLKGSRGVSFTPNHYPSSKGLTRGVRYLFTKRIRNGHLGPIPRLLFKISDLTPSRLSVPLPFTPKNARLTPPTTSIVSSLLSDMLTPAQKKKGGSGLTSLYKPRIWPRTMTRLELDNRP